MLAVVVTDAIQCRFCKQYAQLNGVIVEALMRYKQDVKSGAFPSTEHTYPMDNDELAQFLNWINKQKGLMMKDGNLN
jgi:3-methyl-2-oxobutanoate hydroxymethyltransferase